MAAAVDRASNMILPKNLVKPAWSLHRLDNRNAGKDPIYMYSSDGGR